MNRSMWLVLISLVLTGLIAACAGEVVTVETEVVGEVEVPVDRIVEKEVQKIVEVEKEIVKGGQLSWA